MLLMSCSSIGLIMKMQQEHMPSLSWLAGMGGMHAL